MFSSISKFSGPDKPSPVGSHFFQPKLQINDPNDRYEKEAESMADKVMRMEQPFLQRKCAHCEKEKKMQRKEKKGRETAADG